LALQVEPGFYRVQHEGHGAPIQDFEIPKGVRSHSVTIDLRGAQWVEFEPVLPAGYVPPARVFAVVERTGQDAFNVLADGKFLLLKDSEVRLTIDAPLLRPHPVRGSVVTGTGGKVTLEAVRAPILMFDWTVPQGESRARSGMWLTANGRPTASEMVRVTLDPVGETGGRRSYLAAWPADGRYKCGPFPPGRFDITMQHNGGGAPFVIRDVELGEQDVDLGRVTPLPGSTVDVHLLNLPDEQPMIVTAKPHGGTAMIDSAVVSRKSPRATLGNLPAGKIQIVFRAGEHELTRTVECDGRSTQTIEVDCGDR
jgi:hypothetical protein